MSFCTPMEAYELLEHEFAVFAGTKHAVSVNTGTAALHLALAALRIGPGDEVIIPDFTMAACAFAVMYTGATPVFVDCGKDLNINPHLIELKITPRTKAIMPVHIYGRPCNMTAIMEIARARGLYVVEDCSEAHGATWNGQLVGTFGNAACFSLFKNKIIHAQEGGILTTNEDWIADRARDLKNMAFGSRHDYLHSELAFNYRMPNGQATLALDSLRRYPQNIAKRQKITAWYDRHLANKVIPRPSGSVLWTYDLICGESAQSEILKTVKGARPFFKPMSMQPFCRSNEVGMNALAFSKVGVYLPVHERMQRDEIESIAKSVEKMLDPVDAASLVAV